MQYGDLTTSQIAEFNCAQQGRVRNPTFVIWLEGFGDPTQYVMEIDIEVALESTSEGISNVGNTILIMDNEAGYFYDAGISKVDKYCRINIWAGFSDLNIPIFVGYVNSVKQRGTESTVEISCMDYMGLFQEILIGGNQEPNNTAKLLIESFCSEIQALSNISATDETTTVYSDPSFESCSMKTALDEICKSIFYRAYFDEKGRLQAHEREYKQKVDFEFKNCNVNECEVIRPSGIVNEIMIEYRENFWTRYSDQTSIDKYGKKSRNERTLLLNSQLISSKEQGSTTEELSYDLEAFKFTSQANSSIIDCIHIKMKQSGAHGYILAKIYSDNTGLPGTLIATSQLKASANLSIFFAWEIFYFASAVNISPSSDYWMVMDTTSVSEGEIYVQISAATAAGKHAYYDAGTWHAEDNKQVLHRICGSREAQRVAEDSVRFYKDPRERIRITAPAIPQLQLFDQVLVNIELRGIIGHYVIEARRHILTPEHYTTVDTLRKVG